MRKIYPWEKWLAKKSMVLERGKHFACSPYSFGAQIHTAAKARGKRVKIKCLPDDSFLVTVLDNGKE